MFRAQGYEGERRGESNQQEVRRQVKTTKSGAFSVRWCGRSEPGWFVSDIVAYKRGLKELYELLVENSGLISCKATVLLKDGGKSPSLNFS